MSSPNGKQNFTVLFRGFTGITEISSHSSLISAKREVACINSSVERGKRNSYAYIVHNDPLLVRRTKKKAMQDIFFSAYRGV